MTSTQIVCLVVVLVLAALVAFFIALKSTKHNLVKWTGLFFVIAVALTWIFQYGYYSGSSYVDYGMLYRIGITDIMNLAYYGISFSIDKILFLLVVGCFYAVLNRCEAYKKIVAKIASAFKGGEVIFVILASLLITIMSTLYSQLFVVLIFVPFVISIILSMKLDKITAFSTTFGSMLIGILGATYGNEGLYWFNYYLGTEVTDGLLYRLLVLVIAFVLFTIFNILHVRKALKDKKLNEIEADPFYEERNILEENSKEKKGRNWLAHLYLLIIVGFILFFVFNYYVGLSYGWSFLIACIPLILYIVGIYVAGLVFKLVTNKSYGVSLKKVTNALGLNRTSTWPMVVMMVLVLVLSILGFISWSDTFGITVFTDFHTWLTEITIGETAIFDAILGSLNAAFGSWDLFVFSAVILVMSVLIALMSGVTFDEFCESYVTGAKKMAKSIGIFILIYMIMMVVYFGMPIATINNAIFDGVTTFNPYLTALSAFISSIFHTDFGFTAYAIGGFFSSAFSDSITIVQVIFTSVYGWVQLVMPTSAVLMIGLAYLDIDYKTWIKYIWAFALAMLVILIVLFTLMAYVL